MDIQKFTEIKDKVHKLELESAASKGKIETIEQSWEKKYGFKTVSEAELKCSEIEQDILDKQKNRDSLMDKLKNSFNWESV